MAKKDDSRHRRPIGNIIAPLRFIVFALLLIATASISIPVMGWRIGFMISFDVAAVVFFLSCIPLLNKQPYEMRDTARKNDANRAGLLAITGLVSLAILAAVASTLAKSGLPNTLPLTLIVTTLTLAWAFSNTVYSLHYAHIFYGENNAGSDRGGFLFPGSPEPNYIDFLYFSFGLGMGFQTSDVQLQNSHVRIVVMIHSMAAFIFNIGIIAFTINVLGGL